jgi:hypothetical protein
MNNARSRSRFRLLVTALTGAATVGSLTAAGVTTGALAKAARDSEPPADSADSTASGDGAAAEGTVVRWQDRPRRTVVRRHRVVKVAATLSPGLSSGAAVPAPGAALGGGAVTAVRPSAPSEPAGGPPRAPADGRGGSGGSQPVPPASTSEPVDPPPPPPPAPEPPVPSTGS